MTESTHATLLRRMTRSHDADVVENPLTSSRAVRLALTKAANDTVGLVLSVSSVAEDVSGLDAMLDGLPDGLMLIGLHQQDRLVELIALDMQLCAAVLEMETMGVLSSQSVDDRAPTRTDKMMCDPMIAGFLDVFPQAVRGTDLDGWADDVAHKDRIVDTRTAGLLLDDCRYRIVQMTVQLVPADRQGQVVDGTALCGKPAANHAAHCKAVQLGCRFSQSSARRARDHHRDVAPLQAAIGDGAGLASWDDFTVAGMQCHIGQTIGAGWARRGASQIGAKWRNVGCAIAGASFTLTSRPCVPDQV